MLDLPRQTRSESRNPLSGCRTVILTYLGVSPCFWHMFTHHAYLFVCFLSQRRTLHRLIYISILSSLMSSLTSSLSYCFNRIYSLLVVYGTFLRSYYLTEDFSLVFPQSFGYANTEVRHLFTIYLVIFTYNYLVVISRYLFNISVVWLRKH